MTIRIKSEIAGKVWKIEAKPGDILAEDDPILILESMKMEIPIAAPSRCKLVEILVAEEEAVAEGQTVGEAKVFGGERGYVPLVGPGLVKVMLPRDNSERLNARIVYTGPVPAPVKKGQAIGAVKVWRGDNLILTQPLHAAEDVRAGSLPQRAFDAVTEMVIALFRAGAERL